MENLEVSVLIQTESISGTLQSLQFKFILILKALAISLHKCHFLCEGRD